MTWIHFMDCMFATICFSIMKNDDDSKIKMYHFFYVCDLCDLFYLFQVDFFSDSHAKGIPESNWNATRDVTHCG